MRILSRDLLSLLSWRSPTFTAVCAVVLAVASAAHADFATSGRLNDQNSKLIFHRGAVAQPAGMAAPRGAAMQQPAATDPFLDAPMHVDPQPAAAGPSVSATAPAPSGHAVQQPNSPAGATAEAERGWIHPSVVRVRVEEDDGLANGSGTLIGVDDKHGYVITNWHVVRGASGQITIEFPDGFQSAATVMKMDEEWDLAILVIWKPHAPPMSLSPRLPSPGEPLIIAGYGQGSFRSAKGSMTEFVAPTKDSPFEMFEVSTAARQGDSGGPIVNMQGELAGVLFGAGDGRTTGSHVGRLREFLDEAFRPPAPAQQNDPSQVARSLPPDPSQRTGAQQPAAFHQSESEMDALAREVVAGLPAQPEIPGGNVAVEVPGGTGDLVASIQPLPGTPTAVPTPMPAVVGAEVSGDLLAGIPVADPLEFRMASRSGIGGYSGGQTGTFGGLAAPQQRSGGSAFSDLKTFFVVFGAFAVVFVLLPRDRSS